MPEGRGFTAHLIILNGQCCCLKGNIRHINTLFAVIDDFGVSWNSYTSKCIDNNW